MKKAKKLLFNLISLVSVITFSVSFSSCDDKKTAGTGGTLGGGLGGLGGSGGITHTHVYDQEIANKNYLYSTATCTSKAIYYKSCKCGAKGEERFAYGDFGHIDNNDGTCSACLTKYYSVGLTYILSTDGTYYTVTNIGKCVDTNVIIRSSLNNIPVTTIGSNAFFDCDNLTSITIPDSITAIEEWALYNCDNLTYNIKDNLKYLGNNNNPYIYLVGVIDKTTTNATIDSRCKFIGDYGFANCKKLTNITIPDSMLSIGKWAFEYSLGLTSVYYMGDIAGWCNISGLAYLMENGINLYINNEKVTELIIPDGVKIIKDYAFYNYDSLTNVTLPDSVTEIGDDAFSSCDNLSYNIQGNLKYLGNINNPYIFLAGMVDENATNITIAKTCKFIGSGAFYDCDGLTNVKIGNSVLTIGDGAFYDCDGLTNVTTSNSVTAIGRIVFYSCDNLKSVTIGNSVIKIGWGAFSDCFNLTNMTFEDSSTWYCTNSYRDWQNATDGTQTDVSISSQNATYFKDTYSHYYWYKL